jgi:hypothetical protein
MFDFQPRPESKTTFAPPTPIQKWSRRAVYGGVGLVLGAALFGLFGAAVFAGFGLAVLKAAG